MKQDAAEGEDSANPVEGGAVQVGQHVQVYYEATQRDAFSSLSEKMHPATHHEC